MGYKPELKPEEYTQEERDHVEYIKKYHVDWCYVQTASQEELIDAGGDYGCKCQDPYY